VPDLRAALADKQIGAAVQQVVLGAAERISCQPLERSRDGKSVPCVHEQGTQVAAYPMKHRIAIAMAPDEAESWGRRLGAKLERKSPTTTYLHLVEKQLEDPAIAAGAVEALVVSLELCRNCPQGAYAAEGKPELRDFGSCPEHHYAFNALGLCPKCTGEF
jgi:hypothetical protein